MESFDEIKKYSSTVAQQIRWKKTQNLVAEEIENYFCDQRDAYITEGTDEDATTILYRMLCDT